MLFGPDGEQIPGQGQPNWTPQQYLQNIGNFFNGNLKAIQYLLDPTNWTRPDFISYFIAWQVYRIVNWTLRTLRFLIQELPLLVSVGMSMAITNLGSVGSLVGLGALAGLAQAPVSAAAPLPQPAALALPSPAAAPATAAPSAAVPTSSVAPTTPTTSAPAAATVAASPAAPPVPPIPVTGAEGFGYMVGLAGLKREATLSSRSKAKEPTAQDAAAGTAATAVRGQQDRARRRRGSVTDRGHRYEYLDADDADDVVAEPVTPLTDRPVPSDRRSGPLGFTGTLPKSGAKAAGLATLASDEFGGGPSVPMLPESWCEDLGGETPWNN
ncbi:hypothetical protein [Mycobacterium kyorinense]